MDSDWKESRKRKYDQIKDTKSNSNNEDEEECEGGGHCSKPACKYGSKCYRKNPQHLNDFYHPPNEEEDEVVVLDDNDDDVQEIIPELKKHIPKYYFTTVNDVPNAREINKHSSISLSEILAKDADEFVESAQFNFMFEMDWMLQQYPSKNRSKPLTIIDGGSNSIPKSSNIKHITAKFDNIYGKHHSKMMFLLYKHGMRVVVHTANMIDIDWYQKTNGVWISELFPRIAHSTASNVNIKTSDSKTNFKQYLIMYLEHYNKPELNEWIQHIKTHDMKSANVFLVASAPGRFSSSKRVYGILRIQKLLEDYFIRDLDESDEKAQTSKSKPDRIVCQFSSIGSLGPNENSWLCGQFKNALSASKNAQKTPVSLPICIYPTIDNVLNSFEGVMAGGSLPYSEDTARKQPYLENFFYKWKSDSIGRTKAMPHIKTFARYSNDFSKLYWFLLTSSNLSKAAWGKYEKNETQIHVMSYEIGVLFIPSIFSSDDTKTYFDLKNKNDFVVPYDLPPVKYSTPKDKPWVI